MKKLKAVQFDAHGYARVLTNPAPELLELPNTLVEPDLSAVEGHSPEYWKLEGGAILLMSDEERAARDADLETEHEPTWTSVVEVHVAKLPRWAVYLMAGEGLALVAELIRVLVS